MKRRKYIILVLIISVVTLTSCRKEFLEKEPLGVQTSENFYGTPENAILAINACYDPLSWDEGDGVNHNYEWMFGDVLSDDAEKGSMPSDFPEI